MKNFGGEMTFALSTGQRIVVRGTVEIMPTNLNVEGGANQDGSVYRTAEPTGYSANLTFEDMPNDVWNEIYRASGFNLTLNEIFNGAQHLWTDAGFTGRPSVNRINGEVSGVAILAAAYKKI